MSRICVVTSDGRAYYALVSRLRRAGLAFTSGVPGNAGDDCGLVLTTRGEADLFPGRALALEELDEDPGVVHGQIAARLFGGRRELLMGIDPGLRIGLAVFYGDTRLSVRTLTSRERLYSAVARFVERVPHSRSLVKVGNGNPAQARSYASWFVTHLPKTSVEIVDESGTSTRSPKIRGMKSDEVAASWIAFRKGSRFGA